MAVGGNEKSSASSSGPEEETTVEMIGVGRDGNVEKTNASNASLYQNEMEEQEEPPADINAAMKKDGKVDRRILTSTPGPPESAPYMLDMRSPLMKRWDILMVVLLGFVCIVTPFEVAFVPTVVADPLWIINRIVDAGFLVDMVLQFFLPFYLSSENVFVWNKDLVALNYLKSWFIVDFVSIFPYDFIGPPPGAEDIPGGGSQSNLKVLKVVRLLRLIKLARVFKSARIFTKLQQQYEWTFFTTEMLKLSLSIIIIIHWFACFWGMGPNFSGDSTNWVTLSGMYTVSMWDLYLGSVEFALQALVNGYGDFTPQNTTERLLANILMLFGSMVYGYAIGEICDKTSALNPAQQLYQQNMDLLNSFMTEKDIRKTRRPHYRQFFRFNKETFKNNFYVEELLDNMSPDWQGKLAQWQHGGWMSTIPFFSAKDPTERNEFVKRVSLVLQASAFCPNELVYNEGDISDAMYIVQRGLAATAGFVIASGNFFGEDFVLQSARRKHSARALTYLSTYALTWEDLSELLEKYELKETKQLIRRQAINLSLRSAFKKILALARMAPDYKKMSKEDIENWEKLTEAKTLLKRHQSKSSMVVPSEDEEIKRRKSLQQQEQDKKIDAEKKLNYWLQGHITGEENPEAKAMTGQKDPRAIVRMLQRKSLKFETDLQRAKAMVSHGFERMELHLEAQYKVFQDIVRKHDRAQA